MEKLLYLFISKHDWVSSLTHSDQTYLIASYINIFKIFVNLYLLSTINIKHIACVYKRIDYNTKT